MSSSSATARAIRRQDIARGWAGENDWALVKQEKAEGLSEAQLVERVSAKIKMIDPKYYPRLKDAIGLFKVDPVMVENHILVARALKSEAESLAIKLKHADFADYLIELAQTLNPGRQAPAALGFSRRL